MRPARVEIGRVVAAHGLRGEVRVLPLSDLPGRIESLDQADLRLPHGEIRHLAIRGVRPQAKGILVAFAGVDDRNAADELRGAVLVVDADELPELPADQYYVFDLLGALVLTETGEVLGAIEEVLTAGGNDVLRVLDEQGQEVLLPATREVIRRVDLEAMEVRVRLIPGLRDG